MLAAALVLALLVAIGIVPLLPNGEGQPAIAAFDVVAPQPTASPMPVVTPPTAKRQRPQKPDDKPTTTKEVTIRPDAAAARPEAVDLAQSLIPTDDLSALIAGRGAGEGGAGDGSGTGKGRGKGGRGPNADDDGGPVTMQLAHWVWQPTIQDVAPFNPRAATQARIVGDVLLACRVRLNRRVHDCRVLTEHPSGYGLGEAAIAASRIFRIWPTKQDGRAVDDGWVVVPTHYDFAQHGQ